MATVKTLNLAFGLAKLKAKELKFRLKPADKERKSTSNQYDTQWLNLEVYNQDNEWIPFKLQTPPILTFGVAPPKGRKYGPSIRCTTSSDSKFKGNNELIEFMTELEKYYDNIISQLRECDKCPRTVGNKYKSFTKILLRVTAKGEKLDSPMLYLNINCPDVPKMQDFNVTKIYKLQKVNDTIIEIPIPHTTANCHEILNSGSINVMTIDMSTIALGKEMSIKRFIKKTIVRKANRSEVIDSQKDLTTDQKDMLISQDDEDEDDESLDPPKLDESTTSSTSSNSSGSTSSSTTSGSTSSTSTSSSSSSIDDKNLEALKKIMEGGKTISMDELAKLATTLSISK